VDIGGVLLTDGWDHNARKLAANHFSFDDAEMEGRHRLCFETYEEGKVTMDEHLERVVFFKDRTFTQAQFQSFMFAQSKPFPEMIELIADLKTRHGLKVLVVSNEARELNAHRIRKFKLDRLVDAFISSCFVHLRKPDADIFRLALDVAQVAPEEALYLENTEFFVEIAASLGIRGIHHTDYRSTRERLAELGFDCSVMTARSSGIRDGKPRGLVARTPGSPPSDLVLVGE
jgi:putative hydrolase of the HAD superfamily